MPIYLAADTELLPGTRLVVEAPAHEGPNVVVFEDDGETGYFYALDISNGDNPIQDALHIYDVQQISDRDKPSNLRVGWSKDHEKAVLLINDYPHAVYDFEAKRGYCRSGFPESSGTTWSESGHQWANDALGLFE
ncbi:DUF2251 domain-containing protein [Pseudomonas sp.]|uniref:DUF2251 domain-containing protein n=1 Tax=Pseudomonas sp. TaxID=306 RepID=UPI0028AE5BE2|nr:DUF2251 domain-containing protein [Pseudomonas sp.]